MSGYGRFVRRVGALAVAVGIGAVLLEGSPAALASPGAPASSDGATTDGNRRAGGHQQRERPRGPKPPNHAAQRSRSTRRRPRARRNNTRASTPQRSRRPWMTAPATGSNPPPPVTTTHPGPQRLPVWEAPEHPPRSQPDRRHRAATSTRHPAGQVDATPPLNGRITRHPAGEEVPTAAHHRASHPTRHRAATSANRPDRSPPR